MLVWPGGTVRCPSSGRGPLIPSRPGGVSDKLGREGPAGHRRPAPAARLHRARRGGRSLPALLSTARRNARRWTRLMNSSTGRSPISKRRHRRTRVGLVAAASADEEPTALPRSAAALTGRRSTGGSKTATFATNTAGPSISLLINGGIPSGQRLINRDVPREVVRRILDHD